MAVVRARSAPPYGLFAAVVFAVLATAAAVIFYVMWTKAIDDHDRLVKTADEREKTNIKLTADGKGLNDNLRTANGSIADLTNKLNELQSENARLTTSINTLTVDIAASKAAQSKAEADLAASQSVEGQQRTDYDAAVAKLAKEGQVAVAKNQSDLNDLKQQADDARRPLVLELDDDKSQIAKLSAEILDLRERIQNMRGKEDVAVGEPDGKVISVNNTTGEVYINLGRKDRLLPGMPFTAYDPRTGVRFGTDEAALGDGSLEVIQIQDDTAICRITRTTANRAIQAGDLIANIVYHNDKTRKFRFTVFGDFDLDGDGVATAAERDRLVTLIKAWGGQVDDDVTSQTDYLVLGEKPKAPLSDSTDATPATPADPAAATTPSTDVAGSVGSERSKDQDRYDEMEYAAKRLAIPVLNQNRFLAMVGYYNTTVVRY